MVRAQAWGRGGSLGVLRADGSWEPRGKSWGSREEARLSSRASEKPRAIPPLALQAILGCLNRRLDLE